MDEPKMPWDGNFWDRFLDPAVSAMDMLEKGYKRPYPVEVHSEASSASGVEVERRVFPKPFLAVRVFCSISGMSLSAAGKKRGTLCGKQRYVAGSL